MRAGELQATLMAVAGDRRCEVWIPHPQLPVSTAFFHDDGVPVLVDAGTTARHLHVCGVSLREGVGIAICHEYGCELADAGDTEWVTRHLQMGEEIARALKEFEAAILAIVMASGMYGNTDPECISVQAEGEADA
jgi:hypothetical protein